MKIAFVDDEPICLDKIGQICRDFAVQNQLQFDIHYFTNGEDFLGTFKKDRYSIVFMDIYLEEMSGITAALKMREQDNNCILIFLTSSMNFMPDAFYCHAFEYIVKPISGERVTAVLQDALKILLPQPKYMEINSGRKTLPVLLHDIISVVTDAHYLNISLKDNTTLRSRMTISEFMRLSEDDSRFILINKGILLNADYILSFEDRCCILENGEHFPIRVRGHAKIEETIRNYHFKKICRRF